MFPVPLMFCFIWHVMSNFIVEFLISFLVFFSPPPRVRLSITSNTTSAAVVVKLKSQHLSVTECKHRFIQSEMCAL